MQSRTQVTDLGEYRPHSAERARASDVITDESNRFGPYKRLHRLLRGRYHLLLPVFVIAFGLGAVHGWHKAVPEYRAEGLIHVANSLPKVITNTDQNEPLQMFEEFVQSQVLLMSSRHVITLAMEDPAFKAAASPRKPKSVEEFATDLIVDHPPHTQAIDVSFTCPDPFIASVGVKSLTHAFLESYGANDNLDEERRLAVLTARAASLDQQIADLKVKIGQTPPPTAMSIAMVDDMMRMLLNQKVELETEASSYQAAGYGTARSSTIMATVRLQDVEKKIEDYRKDFTAMQIATASSPPANRHVPMLAEFLGDEEAMDSLRTERDETLHRIDVLKTEGSLGAERFRVLSNGDVPSSPYSDRRLRMAVAYGGAAGMVPLALFLVLGIVNRRVRISDDAVDVGPNIPLLGVLPGLPDRRQDPELARIAAYCVHNLRIRLQLLMRQPDDSAFMIASATAGEGKTSLTLSLAYSFAAAGKRVLLIDCDLVGRGLTMRLGQGDAPGLLESCDGEGLAVVKPVGKNLFLVPAGKASAERIDIGFSHDELKELVDAARPTFDLILMDTGPVISSLQTPVVGQVADHVIMTISQGLPQVMAERSVRILKTVGVRISGLVFNRASPKDYRRWVGDDSYHASAPSSKRQAGIDDSNSQLGPLAHSVAGRLFAATTNGETR